MEEVKVRIVPVNRIQSYTVTVEDKRGAVDTQTAIDCTLIDRVDLRSAIDTIADVRVVLVE